jgi:UDP-2-acetamido-2,6-beta-L-arabino-hexul-4-ose reductase
LKQTIALTGATGMLGFHIRARLHSLPGEFEIKIVERDDLSDTQRILNKIKGAHTLIHLASVIRADANEIVSTNANITRNLIQALEGSTDCRHLIFTSSVLSGTPTPYGESKKKSSELFAAFCQKNNLRFSNLILPGVFGETGRPFHNSVVATFCHQIVSGGELQVNHSNRLEIAHAQSVAELVLKLLKAPPDNLVSDIGINTNKLTVGELEQKLRSMHETYENYCLPNIDIPFDRDLFNTYRSFRFLKSSSSQPVLHTDERGWLFESVRAKSGGQAFISSTKPGITRGNHFHLRKIERFCVLSGEGLIRIRKLFSKDVTSIPVCGQKPMIIDIPTLHTHNIENTGSAEMITLFWTNEIFNPNAPDTYREAVME